MGALRIGLDGGRGHGIGQCWRHGCGALCLGAKRSAARNARLIGVIFVSGQCHDGSQPAGFWINGPNRYCPRIGHGRARGAWGYLRTAVLHPQMGALLQAVLPSAVTGPGQLGHPADDLWNLTPPGGAPYRIRASLAASNRRAEAGSRISPTVSPSVERVSPRSSTTIFSPVAPFK